MSRALLVETDPQLDDVEARSFFFGESSAVGGMHAELGLFLAM